MSGSVVVFVIAIATACSRPTGRATDDAIITEFRNSERAALRTFNDLLAKQRANQIDELELADAIDQQALPQWRKLRARITAATAVLPHRELYVILRRYLASRQTSWEAYTAALRSPSDEAARPHYAVYRAHDAAAVDDARQLGQAFRGP